MVYEKKVITMGDGNKNVMHSWIPDSVDSVKMVMVLSHGMAEYAARYERFASVLTAEGIALFAEDHRGHGETADLAEKETAKFVARPSYNIILASPHNTGGAIDLTIVDEDGIPLDMGCEFDDFSDKTRSDFYEYFDNSEDETSIKIRNNRRMLYNVMTAVGFTNLPSEIWHYDYGNENWAYFNNCAPLYTGILDASVRDSVYYSKADLIKSFDKRQQMHLGSIISAKDECERLAVQLKYSIADDEI